MFFGVFTCNFTGEEKREYYFLKRLPVMDFRAFYGGVFVEKLKGFGDFNREK